MGASLLVCIYDDFHNVITIANFWDEVAQFNACIEFRGDRSVVWDDIACGTRMASRLKAMQELQPHLRVTFPMQFTIHFFHVAANQRCSASIRGFLLDQFERHSIGHFVCICRRRPRHCPLRPRLAAHLGELDDLTRLSVANPPTNRGPADRKHGLNSWPWEVPAPPGTESDGGERFLGHENASPPSIQSSWRPIHRPTPGPERSTPNDLPSSRVYRTHPFQLTAVNSLSNLRPSWSFRKLTPNEAVDRALLLPSSD